MVTSTMTLERWVVHVESLRSRGKEGLVKVSFGRTENGVRNKEVGLGKDDRD